MAFMMLYVAALPSILSLTEQFFILIKNIHSI